MAFNGAFTISQGSNNTSLVITDTSTGSDVNLTSRLLYLYKVDGTTIVPPGTATAYIPWPLSAGNVLTVNNILSVDLALNANVAWTSSNPLPAPSTYTQTVAFGSTGFLSAFLYARIQDLRATPALINSKNFFESLSKLQTELDNVGLSIQYGTIGDAQFALDRAAVIQNNQAYYFN